MKIRNGFVSNSSTSSFIVAIAKVVDEERVMKWISDNKLEYVTEIRKFGDEESEDKGLDYRHGGGWSLTEKASGRILFIDELCNKNFVVSGFKPGDKYVVFNGNLKEDCDWDSPDIDKDSCNNEGEFYKFILRGGDGMFSSYNGAYAIGMN